MYRSISLLSDLHLTAVYHCVYIDQIKCHTGIENSLKKRLFLIKIY